MRADAPGAGSPTSGSPAAAAPQAGPRRGATRVPPDTLELDGLGRLSLQRAWPRPDGTVLLELTDADQQVVAGRWYPEGAELPAGGEAVTDASGTTVLHRVRRSDGADPRLPALAADLAAGGRLLSHRLGRRAVVQRRDGSFAKHVRPAAVDAVLGGLAQAAEALRGVAEVARVRTVEPSAVVVLEPLPGPSLLELGRTGSEAELVRGWRETGVLLAALHAGPPGEARWRPTDEVRAAHRLVQPARDAGLLTAAADRALVAASEQLLGLPAGGRPVPLHRDLHDQQLLLGPPRTDRLGLGLLDCDTTSGGDAAVDLGNLLAHLRLRVLQGLLTPGRAELAEQTLRQHRGEAGLTPASVLAHRRITLVRLAGLYAWRPRWRHLCEPLLHAAMD